MIDLSFSPQESFDMSICLKSRAGDGIVLISDNLAMDIPSIDEFMDRNDHDPIAHIKLFTINGWRWFILAFDRDTMTAYAYVQAPRVPGGECGTVNLRELADFTFLSGFLGVERDLYFEPRPLSQVRKSIENNASRKES
jgi:hypothetical protein